MIILGLTGSLGMGKTAAAGMLRRLRVPVHDADAASHRAIVHGGGGEAAVRDAFPTSWKNGHIDRHALRAALGDDEKKWRTLEAIIHPLVRLEEQAFLRHARAGGVPIVALDIPLLFETGGEGRCDYTICVSAPAFLQWQRAKARGMSRTDFEQRLSRQMPDVQKRAKADFVVQTGLGRAYTFRELHRIVRSLKAKA